VPQPGAVRLEATFRTPHGHETTCSDRVEAPVAGLLELRCRLSSELRARLARHSLSLRLVATLETASRELLSVADRIRLPRG
jgi:hypothetical protein